MSYIDGRLLKGERVLYRRRPHFIACARPAVTVLASLGASVWLIRSFSPWLGVALVALAVFSWAPALLRYYSSEYGVTNKRIFIQSGWMGRRTAETPIQKIAFVAVDQDPWGRIMNYGKIVLNGSGGPVGTLTNVRAPLQFQQEVFEQVLSQSRR